MFEKGEVRIIDKKEIKDYLKRVEELGAKLMGEDKETYTWLIYGYTQCAKLLNETEQQCKKQKEVIDKAIEYINQHWVIDDPVLFKNDLLEILEDGKNE